MKYRSLLAVALVAFAVATEAQVAPPEKLLPNDTLVLVSVPDATKFRAALKNSPQGQLWNDPLLKAFKDKFVSKFKTDLAAPLEKELGVKFSDYEGLAQGQFTFAMTQNGWQGKTNQSLGWIFLIDTKEKSGVLKTNLANLKKKWVDSGKQIKMEKLRDIEFTTLISSTDNFTPILEKVFPRSKKGDPDEPKAPGRKLEILVGQSGSLLLVGNSAKVMEKVLVHQAGALAPSLSEEVSYEANHNAMFRDAPFYAWFNVKPFFEIWAREAAGGEPSANPLMPKSDKIISSTGLGGLKTVAFSYRTALEGAAMQLSLGIPEANRQGLFKILAADKMESSPPAFVPIDVTKFTRWRLNLPKAWTGLENLLSDISPAFGGVFKLIFESAGKDKDPNFDLKKELLGNLGDDLINYQRKPANSGVADLNSPPSLYLLGSPAPEKLASALKIGISLLSPAPLKERDFLGRKIYQLPPSPVQANPKGVGRALSFSASSGYLALSTDVPMLEEYLRSSETKPKALSELVGLKEAAEKVDGMGMGLFGFNNQTEGMRATLTALRKESATLSDLLKNPALGAKTPDEEKKINDWADFSLLPPYENISKYFHYSVYSGSFNASGFTMKFFYPTPPLLKK
ncbi:MAG: hypothetical protein ABIR24_10525 [Verrucomicrobiota bacterium]